MLAQFGGQLGGFEGGSASRRFNGTKLPPSLGIRSLVELLWGSSA